jgi:hypothetical protein
MKILCLEKIENIQPNTIISPVDNQVMGPFLFLVRNAFLEREINVTIVAWGKGTCGKDYLSIYSE